MIDDWVGHYHRRPDSLLARLPAGLKLTVALIVIVGTVLMPAHQPFWFAGVALGLILMAWSSRIPLLFLL